MNAIDLFSVPGVGEQRSCQVVGKRTPSFIASLSSSATFLSTLSTVMQFDHYSFDRAVIPWQWGANFRHFQGSPMAKQVERGIKRTCNACSNQFYDLNRDPINCPQCGAANKLEKPAKARQPAKETIEKVPEKVAEAEAPVAAPAVEVISLEEAEAAESDGDSDFEDEENIADIETDDVEISKDDDDTFLEQEDEGAADVSGIVGKPTDKREES